jgi:predicted nucleotide-binding protein
MLLNDHMDFDQWVVGTVTVLGMPPAGAPPSSVLVRIDSALISDLAGFLSTDQEELALTVRGMLDEHRVSAPVYEIRTGGWRIDLPLATAKAVLSGAIATTVMQHMGADGFPAAILCAVAALLFSIHRVEVSPSDLVLHAKLLNAGLATPGDLNSLYQALPEDVRGELTIGELADLIERFHQAGLARWDGGGITLAEAARGRKVRLVVREPGFGLVASQAGAAAGKGFTGMAAVSRKVFVIHGRDEQARSTMFELLRAVDLQPQEWEPLVAATGSTLPNLNEVVATGLAAGQAQAVVAILTPDDIVTLHPALRAADDPADETSSVMQPRPNVLIELGMALSAYRHRTIIVAIGALRRIADLDGLNVIRFDGSETAIGKLVERLKLAGCAVDDKGSDWRVTRRFTGLDAYARRPC